MWELMILKPDRWERLNMSTRQGALTFMAEMPAEDFITAVLYMPNGGGVERVRISGEWINDYRNIEL